MQLIFRHPKSNYYKDDILESPKHYTDDYFRELKKNGWNAVWMAGVLRHLSKTKAIPEWGESKDRNIGALRLTVARAERHGVKVFIYLNEPRNFPLHEKAIKRHPEVVGQKYHWPYDIKENRGPWCLAMCASSEKTLGFLEEGCRDLFTSVPGLGGLLLITASEHVTTCHSRAFLSSLERDSQKTDLVCPRCQKKERFQITADIINAMHRGAISGNPSAEIVAWNWSWNSVIEDDPQPHLIRALNPGVALMGDFERGDHRMIDGKKRVVDEYSLSYVGPSGRFKKLSREAKKNHKKIYIKLQVGTTHELATVEHLPLLSNLYEKTVAAREFSPAGIMGTWNFGNFFSLNTFAFHLFMSRKYKNEKAAFRDLLESYFDHEVNLTSFTDAMHFFRKAFDFYPYSMPFLYYSPINYAPAFPIDFPEPKKPMAGSWLVQEWGYRLPDSFGGFTAKEIASCLEKTFGFWNMGIEKLSQSFSRLGKKESAVLFNARGILHTLQSTKNIYLSWDLLSSLKLRKRLLKDRRFQEIARNEGAHLKDLLKIFDKIPHYGRHNECQADLFTKTMVKKKLQNIQKWAL